MTDGNHVPTHAAPDRSTPHAHPHRQVAIVGAGMAGLVAARELLSHGWQVTLWEKSRGVGGRMATRRATLPGPNTPLTEVANSDQPTPVSASTIELSFDHGAQYFTARDERFQREVANWCSLGCAGPWPVRVVELRRGQAHEKTDQPTRFVGLPSMTAIARHLAAGLDIRFEARITRTQRRPAGWTLTDDRGSEHGPYSALLLTAPAPQTSGLLGEHAWLDSLASVQMTPCWTVMVAFRQSVRVTWSGAFVHDSPLAWVACNSHKPDRRAEPECWVLQASAAWTQAHLETPRETVGRELLAEFQSLLTSIGAEGGTAPAEPLTPVHLDAHRWMFAAVPQGLTEGYRYDAELALGLAGDWLQGGRVEGAYLSGLRAAEAIWQAGETER